MSLSFDELADRFAKAVRDGEDSEPERWADRHPEHREAILDLFPTIRAMERVKSSSGTRRPVVSISIGDRLGDFEILREIGRGGMGVVFEARQASLGRIVALKVLPRSEDPRRVQRFDREVRTVAKLHHTNIVPIFGVGEFEGWHFYVMPVIRGVSLDRVAAQMQLDSDGGRPTRVVHNSSSSPSVAEVVANLYAVGHSDRPPETASSRDASGPTAAPVEPAGVRGRRGKDPVWRAIADIGRQASAGLAHAHQAGVLHRDIKPANLLLDTDGIVWITDFGLATAVDSDGLTRTGDVLGTVQYLAPEQLEGRADARSDVFALGLTLYELCSGQPARKGAERAEMLKRAAEMRSTDLAKLVPSVPKDLATIVQKAIEPDPRHRYRTARDLENDLERYLEGRPITARRTSKIEDSWRWCRRNRAVASLAALAFLGSVGGGTAAGIGWWRASQSSRVSEQRLREAYEGFENIAAALVGIGSLQVAENEGDDDTALETVLEWQFEVVSDRERATARELLAFYGSLASEVETEDDLELRARAFRWQGDLQGMLREFDAARESYATALDSYRRLPGEGPRLARVNIYSRLVSLELAGGIERVAPGLDRVKLARLLAGGIDEDRLQAARDHASRMRELLVGLERPEARYERARSEHWLAQIERMSAQPELAQAHAESAQELVVALCEDFPNDVRFADGAVTVSLFAIGRGPRGQAPSLTVCERSVTALRALARNLFPGDRPSDSDRLRVENCLRLARDLSRVARRVDGFVLEHPYEPVVERVLSLEPDYAGETRGAILALIFRSGNPFMMRDADARTEFFDRFLNEIVEVPPGTDLSAEGAARQALRDLLRSELDAVVESFRQARRAAPRRR